MNFEQIEQLAKIIKKADSTVAVTGAGISTEAGIPDFRGPDGIYTKMGGEAKVMSLISIDAFRRDPAKFYDFHWKRFDFPPVAPCKAHTVLVDMEKAKLIKGIVTQNIDGLHQKAGSKNIIPFHGNADQYICTSCSKLYGSDHAKAAAPGIPFCEACGGVLKPNIVLFGESISNFGPAYEMIMDAGCLLVIGTSLNVYPLAGLVAEYSALHRNMIIINRGPTQLDSAAAFKIEVNEDETLGAIMEEIYKAVSG